MIPDASKSVRVLMRVNTSSPNLIANSSGLLGEARSAEIMRLLGEVWSFCARASVPKSRARDTASELSSEIILAPSEISRLVPAEVGEKIYPGIAYSVLPKSIAASAVVIVPERMPASVTTRTDPSAAIMAFLLGKAKRRGGVFHGSKDRTTPCS